ncbi:hypothetical protein [Nostoc sp.]
MSSALGSQPGEFSTAHVGAAATLIYQRLRQRERQGQTSPALPAQQSGCP